VEFRAVIAAGRLLGFALTRYVLALGPAAAATSDDLGRRSARRWIATSPATSGRPAKAASASI
jgi:hypothetical protein